MSSVKVSQKLLLRALRGEKTERPPIWLMRQAGRYLPEYLAVRDQAGGMLALCTSPRFAAEVTLQPLRRFGLDGAILFADLPQLPAALGQQLEYREGDGPVLEPAIGSVADIERHLSLTRLHEKLAPVYETVQRLARELPPEVALIGYAGAPWTVATYMVQGRVGPDPEYGKVKQWSLGDPDGFQTLIDLVTEATGQYLERQIEAGAEAIQLFDTWAGIVPEAHFERWCVQPVAAIIRRLRQKYPEIPLIAFPRGAGLLYPSYARATGANVIGLDSSVPVRWAAEHLQRGLGLCVQGNLDPQLLVVGGERMLDEARRIIDVLGQGPFVFNLGHGISRFTRPEHVGELVRYVSGRS